jgi:nucleotide-binding universal stress UspA family protein
MAFTVLVGYDGKPPARAALDVALGLAGRLEGRVIITYLVETALDPYARAEERINGQLVTKGALMAAGNRGVDAEALIAERPVVEGLISLAEERGADLLVVGDSRRSPIAGALRGSVGQALLHRTTVPLVMVPAPEARNSRAA